MVTFTPISSDDGDASPFLVLVEGKSKDYDWYMPALPFDESLTETLDAWKRYEVASGHSPQTIHSRITTVQRLARRVDPLTATTTQLIDWVSALTAPRSGEPIARTTRATYRAQLRSFYAWLTDTGRRDDNPALKLPRVKPPRGVPHPVSPADVRRMLDACSDRRAIVTRAYIVLGAYAGMRVHEIAKVRGEDMLGDEIRIQGKGGTDSTVPMHPLIAELVPLFPARGWWFPSMSAEGHVTRESVSAAVKRAMVRAGVQGTAHGLRHHFGTQVLRAAHGDLRTAQRALRHASPATTAIYTLVADETLRSAVGGIPAA